MKFNKLVLWFFFKSINMWTLNKNAFKLIEMVFKVVCIWPLKNIVFDIHTLKSNVKDD